MKYSDEFKAHIKQPGLNEEEFAELVQMVKDKVDVVEIYKWLATRFKDPRTRQKWLDKALKSAY